MTLPDASEELIPKWVECIGNWMRGREMLSC